MKPPSKKTKRKKSNIPEEITLHYRKLGREKARGQYIEAQNLIEIDSRLDGEEHLEVLLHETLHVLQPHHIEEVVERDAKNLARILWEDGYRRLPEPQDPPKEKKTKYKKTTKS